MKVHTVDILGVPFSTLTMEETIQYLFGQLKQERRQTFHVVTANPEIVMCARKDSAFQNDLLQADLITPDGIGVVKASGMLGEPLQERVSGFDLMNGWFAQAEQQGRQLSVFLLGAKPHVVERAAKELRRLYPSLQVAGHQHGYFGADEEEQIVEKIAAAKPDILLVALGFPRQEKFIQTHKQRLQTKIAVGVGGSFDVWAGEAKRAPKWIQSIHLEWFYRLCKTPSRWRRQLVLLEFLQHVLRERKMVR
ncbi:WecB/TagA/CpsF family glycosyltransferase [Ectobacillus ponti]|uniref:N-acetylglucosaminyldiphosphoundecaprenol N-acetyl-beta-D-mannosaminyltransferase n=1 Tax=Ectobacillus ponti TaxID=2961894 RepID=A0AA42BNJ3_9BACI|nr:WecB/TagA/CpsF family glycosyltransferase [Ectobacillus ponti]MCP8968050.1 WecB/TagA/CpsF family glycosyltransferase [Ectobacillus ponti]